MGKRLRLHEEKMRLQKVILLRSALAFLLAIFATSFQAAFPLL